MPVHEGAVNGNGQRSDDGFQVGDQVMFTQGILEGLTGVVTAYGGSRGFLVMTNHWPTGVGVLVGNHSLRKRKPAMRESTTG